MEIKPNYVTFQQAKLFKEKGLVAKSDRYWVKMTEDSYTEMTDRRLEDLDSDIGIGGNLVITKYQQWQVVEWLRINHGIWVSPGIITLNGVVKWFPRYFKFANALLEIPKDIDGNFDTPQEAYSAAFDYIINNNLI